MRELPASQGVALLIDQHMHEPDAIYVDFFERPAATTSALAALALRTGAPVVPVFALPLPRGRYRLIYEHPVSRRAPTRPTRSASSRSAALTCWRCTCAAIPSCGSGCIGGGETQDDRRPACRHVACATSRKWRAMSDGRGSSSSRRTGWATP